MPLSPFVVNVLRVLLLKESKEYPFLPSGLVIFRRQSWPNRLLANKHFSFCKILLA